MKMGVGNGHRFIPTLAVVASMLAAACMGSRKAWPPAEPLHSPSPRKIVVGGSENWHFGFNYSDWAAKNAPFYQKDTLVFKYEAPNETAQIRPHNVYQLPDISSYAACDLKNGKLVANITQGGGNGFEFPLEEAKLYIFACGVGNGIHCNAGLMKFFVFALPTSHD
ncbi:early nodulin-like protein 20 [Malania oleifera]|uniref:early nodulin-like protein 20 n=1 Tax=Malania oleifera TaxID=397392 RepID=UPI0025ADC872|nr:early nodulin-like protein 20 [Malania oleifera]